MKLYDDLDLTKKMCIRCLKITKPIAKRGKKKWKGHIFLCCQHCDSKVFMN